jgi:hypothetical protein
MNRIDRNRKGMVFSEMTEEEQACLKSAKAAGKTIISVRYPTGWECIINPDWYNNIAYWVKEWDEPEGEELVGLLCHLDDTEEELDIIAFVTEYDPKSVYSKYLYGNGPIGRRYAKPIRKEDVEFTKDGYVKLKDKEQ